MDANAKWVYRQSSFQVLDEPVLCVRPGVKRRDLFESIAIIESARLDQIISGVKLKAGDPLVSGDRLEFIQKRAWLLQRIVAALGVSGAYVDDLAGSVSIDQEISVVARIGGGRDLLDPGRR